MDIRQVRPEDLVACYALEWDSFTNSEAASIENISRRIDLFPEGFLVMEQAGKIIGMVNSGATHKDDISDEALKRLAGHDSAGANIVIFSLSVLPAYQRRGLGTQLMQAFIERARQLGKQQILLMCKAPLIAYYARFGFVERGLSPSTHGGSQWYEMSLDLSALPDTQNKL